MRQLVLTTLTLAGLVTTLAVSPARANEPTGPMATLKIKNGEVDRLLRQKVGTGSAEERKQKDDVRTLAASLLDYGELAKRALAQHWDGLKSTDRDEFVTTLKELIERSYVRQLRSNLDYQVLYKDETVKGDEATVVTVVKVKTQGKSTDAEIVYKLRRLPNDVRWMVWDVVTDEVSLVRNYKTQFNKIISEQGYPKLLEKMRTKLKEKEL